MLIEGHDPSSAIAQILHIHWFNMALFVSVVNNEFVVVYSYLVFQGFNKFDLTSLALLNREHLGVEKK